PQGMPCGADTSSAKLGIFTSAQVGSIQPVPTQENRRGKL
ncbi:hypothetical protein ACSSV1_006350, partial [Labrenzia sp. MBR-25]